MRRAPSPRWVHQPRQFPGELRDGADEVDFQCDRFGKAALHDIGRDRQAWRDRFVDKSERLVEAAQEILAEAGSEWRARAIDDVGDSHQPDLRQGLHAHGRDPQRCERQRKQGFAGLAAGDDGGVRPMMRHRPGAADRVGHGGAGLPSETGKARDEVAAERRLAAEQMHTAGDVQQQPVRRIEAQQRRVTIAPIGDGVERLPLGCGIGLGHGDLRIHRAGIGEHVAASEMDELLKALPHRLTQLPGIGRNNDVPATAALKVAQRHALEKQRVEGVRQEKRVGKAPLPQNSRALITPGLGSRRPATARGSACRSR